jgi:hypothetical protein
MWKYYLTLLESWQLYHPHRPHRSVCKYLDPDLFHSCSFQMNYLTFLFNSLYISAYTISGKLWSSSRYREIPFSLAYNSNMYINICIDSLMFVRSIFFWNLPFFIWYKSSMSFTKYSNINDEFWTIWSILWPHSPCTNYVRVDSNPIMAFNGVLISCDTVAVNIS